MLWTLSAEILFYVIMAAVAAALGPRFGCRGIVVAALGCLFLVYGGLVLSSGAPAWPALGTFARYTSFNAVYVLFMLVGAALYRGFFQRESRHDCALTVATLFAFFSLGILLFEHYSPRTIGTDVWTAVFTFGVFVAFVVAGRGLKAWKVATFFADISYPLYLVHLPLAWIMLHEITKRDISLHIAVPVAFAAIVLASWILHRFIEVPFQQWGQKIGRGIGSAPACQSRAAKVSTSIAPV